MADELKKISELQSVVSLDGSEVLPIVQSGVTKKVTVEQILDEVDSYTKSEADTLLLNKVDKVSGKGLSTNDFTNELLTLLTTNKVKNVTTDAVNDRLVITYTDNTTSNLNLSDIINDVYVSGATLDATTNVLTLTSTNGGADVTVNLSEFVDNDQFNNAQNAFQGYIDNINQKFTDMNEPSGFIRELPNTIGIMELSLDGVTIHKIDQNGNYTTRSDSKFASGTSFEAPATTMTFAMYPVNDTYTIYIEGTKHDIASLQTTSIANASGLQFVYHNLDGTLGSSTTFSFDYFEDMPVTSLVYINATSGKLVTFADERHGIQMDGMTHRYLHFTQGAKYISGMDIQGVASGDTTHTNITSGIGYDEDIYIQTPQQTTSQHLYKNSTSWELVTASDSIGIINSGVAQYNYNDNGTFSLADVPTDKFVSMFFVMTNNRVSPYIKIPSQHTYSSVADAITNINTDLNSIVLSGLSTPEFIVIGAVVLNRLGQVQEISTGITIYDLRSVRILASGGGIASSTSIQHQDLLNIQGGVSGEYYHLTEVELTKLSNALTSETNTTLTLVGNVLTYTGENGVPVQHDLSIYLDDTNLARIISGVYDANTNSLVFTRDDSSTFSIDASMFFDDTNIVTSVNGKTGAVTITKSDIGLPNVTNEAQEVLSNKKTDMEANKTSDTFFPSIKAVYDWAKGLFVSKVASTDNAIATFNGTGGELQDNTSFLDRMHLGIGTSIAGWSDTFSSIDFLGNGGFVGGTTFQYLCHNIYSDGTNWRYKSDGAGGAIRLGQDGSVVVSYVVAGTAGAIATLVPNFKLDADGQIGGAGTTTSAWGVGQKAIEWTNGNAIMTDGSATHLCANCYYDGTSWRYKVDGAASILDVYRGTFLFRIAPAGVAGAVITWLNAMDIDANGEINPVSIAPTTARTMYFIRSAGVAGITAATNYPLFPSSADTLTLAIGVYKVSMSLYISVATSTVSSTLNINMRGGGTAVGNLFGTSRGTITNGGTPVQNSLGSSIATNASVTAASAVAGRVYVVNVEAIMDITTAGTIIPSYQWGATLTSGVVTLSSLNNLVIEKIANTSVATTGGWA